MVVRVREKFEKLNLKNIFYVDKEMQLITIEFCIKQRNLKRTISFPFV